MKELVRIVEHQAKLYSHQATQDKEFAEQLELLVEKTKPNLPFTEWHPLIATPFRYAPPHPDARFRPPYGRNVFYASFYEETALHEHAFHFMKQRVHLDFQIETGVRTIFFVDADARHATDIKHLSNVASIMDKQDYSFSHDYIRAHPKVTFLIYPSCRDPFGRENAAIFDIRQLEKMPKWEWSITYIYDNLNREMTWVDYNLQISSPHLP